MILAAWGNDVSNRYTFQRAWNMIAALRSYVFAELIKIEFAMFIVRSKRQQPRLMVCLVAALVFLSLLAFADETPMGVWRWQNPRPQGNPLYAIKFSDARRGVAVGRDGAILK